MPLSTKKDLIEPFGSIKSNLELLAGLVRSKKQKER